MTTGTSKRATWTAVDVDDLQALADRVDTKYGHDPLVAGLIGTVDRMIESLQVNGRVYKRQRQRPAGVSGYRNVTWHAPSKRWQARLQYRDGRGQWKRKHLGYFAEAEQASIAVEELRAKLGLS